MLFLDGNDRHTIVGNPPAGGLQRANETSIAAVADGSFTLTYSSSVPAQAKPVIESAAKSWAEILDIAVPISVEVRWTVLPAGILAGATPTVAVAGHPAAPNGDAFYPIALLNQLHGTDLLPDEPQILVVIADRTDWHYGTTGAVPSGTVSLASVVRHEIVHGLGFFSAFDVDPSTGEGFTDPSTDSLPTIFDTFVADAQNRALTDTTFYPSPSRALGAALESGALHWSGSAGVAAGMASASRRPPVIEAPNGFELGGSVVHLDEATYPPGDPDSLTTSALSSAEGIQIIGTIAPAMLVDLGWRRRSSTTTTSSTSTTSTTSTTTTVAPVTTTTLPVTTTTVPATSTTSTPSTSTTTVGAGPAGRGGGDLQLGVLARTGFGGYGWLLSRTMITLACGLGLLWVSRLYGRRPQQGEDVPQA